MWRNKVTVGFLNYKPNIYKFMYSITCQISELLLFSDVAPVLIRENVCFLFYKRHGTSEHEAYRTINAILCYNIDKFSQRYGADFDEDFKLDLTVLRARFINENFFVFAVNRSICGDYGGTLITENGQFMQYNCAMQPKNIPVYGNMPHAYTRDSINIDKSSLLLENLGILERKQTTSIWKRFKYFIIRNFNCKF